MSHQVTCPKCKGSGTVTSRPGTAPSLCPQCSGTGKLVIREDQGTQKVTKRLVEA